jgi:hypothetical protein
MGTLHEDQNVFLIKSRKLFLKWKKFQIGKGNQNKHFILNNFFSEIRAFYEIMWKNLVQPDRPQIT